MSVAGLRYQQPDAWGHSSPAETKSGSYIYNGLASSFHDWEFRTRARVLQHRERQRRELLKDLRASSVAKSKSASPRRWRGKTTRNASSNPTEGAESSGIAASPSSARRTRPAPPAEDDGAESERSQAPSHPSRVDDDDDNDSYPDTDPATYTLQDVKDESIDMNECVSKVLEGLRGDAFSIARDIGLTRLLEHDGIDHLIEEIRAQAFPLQSEEASELFRQGQLINGPLAKQPGESMLSYVARRKRWWSTLRELDPDIRLSEAMRANLLVELSGLDRTEQLMIKTAARTHSVEEYARVLIQHHSVVHMKERLLTAKDTPNSGKPWGRFPNSRPQDRYPKFGYLGFDPNEGDTNAGADDGSADGYGHDGYGYEAYPATAPEPDDEWIEDEDLALQLNAYTAVAYEAEVDDLDDSFAESVQLAYAAQTAFTQVKGKGKGKLKGKPGGKAGGKLAKSNLTIADRKSEAR